MSSLSTVYPLWGRIGRMPLDDSIRKNVGFVWGDRSSHGVASRGPVGTFFVVTVPSERWPDRRYGYAVTAAHVVIDQNTSELRMRANDESLVGFYGAQWFIPFPERDIAVSPFTYEEEQGRRVPPMTAVPIDQLGADVLGWRPRLGSPVYYVGLLDRVEEMSNRVLPMVRSGNVGALFQAGVKVEDQEPQIAHLIDVRSRRGFSGSPCWAEVIVIGPGPLPAIGSEHAPSDLSGFSVQHYTQALWGMLVGYADDAGVGVVLPIEQIREVLNHEEIRSMRDKNDELIAKEREKGDFEEIGVSDESFSEDAFLSDLGKATRRLGDESDREPKSTSE